MISKTALPGSRQYFGSGSKITDAAMTSTLCNPTVSVLLHPVPCQSIYGIILST